MQNQSEISREIINRDIRSPFLILSAVFCVVAVFCAVPGIILLFDREASELYQIFLGLDYIDASAQKSWLFVRGLIKVLAFAVPLAIGIGLFLLLAATFAQSAKRLPMWGFTYFSRSTRVFQIIVYAVGIFLAGMFIFRALRYVIVNGAEIGGVLFIFAMLLPECVFLAVVAIIFLLTIRCLKSVVSTLDTIQLNVLTGKNETYGMTPGAVWFIAAIGVAAVVLCAISDELTAMIGFGFSAAAYFLLIIWISLYRRKVGRRALDKFRQSKNESQILF